MKISVEISDEVTNKIEQMCQEKLEGIVEQVVADNIDYILLDTVKKQLKSVAIMYIQSPELRRKMLEKVTPAVDRLVG